MDVLGSPAMLLLDLPPAALAGIDLLSFTVTPRFKGVREVPEGFHFAFVGTSTVLSERYGLWFEVTKGKDHSLYVAKWLPQQEILVQETDLAEQMRWRANIGDFWRVGLTPYRQSSASTTTEELDDWPALTASITEPLLCRIVAKNSWCLSSGSSALQDIEAIPGIQSTSEASEFQDQILHFLPINLKQTWPSGATGRQRTEAAQDRSWALLNLSADLDEILGEMQFCFLMLMTLNNFSCLEQWKRILELVLTSKTAVSTHPDFFVRVIALLQLQLRHCKDAEGGLIDLADEGSSLLSALLSRFRKGVEGLKAAGNVAAVLDELDDLEAYLHDSHGWQFGGQFARSGLLELEDGEQVRALTTAYDEDDELGEYAPQIVELTTEQMNMLGDASNMVLQEDRVMLGLNTDWGVRRPLGLASGTYVESRGVENYVVDDEESSENEEEAEKLNAESKHDDRDADEDEEDTQNLEDMDARF